MDTFYETLTAIQWVWRSALGLGMGVFIGSFGAFKAEGRDEKAYAFFAFVAVLIGAAAQVLLKQQDYHSIVLLFSALLICIGLISMAQGIKINPSQSYLQTTAYLCVTVILAFLIGIGYAALSIGLLAIVTVLLMGLDRYKTEPTTPKKYALNIECSKLVGLEKIEGLFERLKIEVVEKSIVKNRWIILQVSYNTTPMIQHVLLKRLFKLKGLGKIVKI